MKTRDVVIGFVVLVLFIVGILLIFRVKNAKKALNTPLPTPNFEQVESKFPRLVIPENADKAILNSVSSYSGMGEAIRVSDNNSFNITVAADLSETTPGYFYQGWLTDGSSYLSLGKLNVGKGGYIVNFLSKKNYSSYARVIVTLEKTLDSTPETRVLEGSF